ncbi:hypothetical protein EOE18_13925 [Novosphingobium umbonatum]|uniref:Uncharacterized protein n=1 Tax=Novosphingobium umbonatum TaxID=1908524 RepID=A0A3S3TLR5_9SPHN|nr:hypothetical protein [Novosphingobium umbonatum]RVU03947.1 hypothetical protein EOE18_13925 [Novosphingobium umbonatum]
MADPQVITEAQRFTLSDSQRLLRKSDVEGICRSPDLCWHYSDTARCGPCAIKQAQELGVEPDHRMPNLPEVYRQRRANEALRAEIAQATDHIRKLVDAINKGTDPQSAVICALLWTVRNKPDETA